jgi:hypothetical protein
MGAVIRNGSEVPLLVKEPAATHSQLVTHDTPTACDCTKSVLEGVVAADQVVPFQDMAVGPNPFTGVNAKPTAEQVVGLKQSTPSTKLASLAEELGVATIVQAVPFHVSASDWDVPDAFVSPTAWQNTAPAHDTALNSAESPLGRVPFGLVTMVHAVPFHISVSVTVEVPEAAVPTAMQNEPPLQETPKKSLSPEPAGLGLVTMFQAVPFHCSMRVEVVAPATDEPTATQSVALAQETALSCDWSVAGGAGAVAAVHAVPSHCSMRGRLVEPTSPTAAQKLVPTQDTPFSVGDPVRAGLAMGVHVVPSQRSMKLPVAALVDPTAMQNAEVVHDTPSRKSWSDVPVLGVTAVQFVAFTVGGTVMAAPAGAPPSASRGQAKMLRTSAALGTIRCMSTPLGGVTPG